jgi:hypothetical protein
MTWAGFRLAGMGHLNILNKKEEYDITLDLKKQGKESKW